MFTARKRSEPFSVEYWGRAPGRCGRPLPQNLDSIDDAEPITDASDAHLLQSYLVEFEYNIPTDIVGLEGVGMSAAFYVSQPTSDVDV